LNSVNSVDEKQDRDIHNKSRVGERTSKKKEFATKIHA